MGFPLVPAAFGRMASPPWPAAVRAGWADHPAPLYSALGGDLPPAVQAATQVCVMVLQVLRHEFQAVLASLHLVGIVGVDRGHSLVPAQGAVPGPPGVKVQILPGCRRTGALGGRRGTPRPGRGRPGYCCWPLLRAAPLLLAPVAVPLGLLPAGRFPE